MNNENNENYYAQKSDEGKPKPLEDSFFPLITNSRFMSKAQLVAACAFIPQESCMITLLANIPEKYRDLGVANATHLGFLKYGQWNGWRQVPDALLRYKAAALRHFLFEKYYPEDAHDGMDTDSKAFIPGGVHHMSLAACNLAFVIELEAAQ